MSIKINSFQGIGDNVMQRIYVRALAAREKEPVYIDTAIPELYSDIPNLKFICPETNWRTQKKIQNRFQGYVKPEDIPKKFSQILTLKYGAEDLMSKSIFQTFDSIIPLEEYPFIYDLPRYDSAFKVKDNRPIAVIRPVTARREWYTPSRNPDPYYINWIADYLKKNGFCVISIADLAPNQEWIEPNGSKGPAADVQFHSGELTIPQLIDLHHKAAVTVSGIGFATTFGIAAGTPHFMVFGGRGKFDCLQNITDIRMDLSKVGWAVPDNFCKCDSATHACNKGISNLPEKFIEFLAKPSVASHIQSKFKRQLLVEE